MQKCRGDGVDVFEHLLSVLPSFVWASVSCGQSSFVFWQAVHQVVANPVVHRLSLLVMLLGHAVW